MEEKNILIAQFMGFPKLSTASGIEFDLLSIVGGGDDPDTKHFYDPDDMKFHESWDWLIPVIEKCAESQIFGSQRLITNIFNRLISLDILAVHANVVTFIEFYNQNKPRP
jgi:hypothetical protein